LPCIPDSFSFTVTDDNSAGGPALTSDPATVTITVNPGNDPPNAMDDLAGMFVDGLVLPITIPVLVNDTDVDFDMPAEELTIQSVTHGTNGSVSINGDGTVTYTHNGTYTTGDSFQYTIVGTIDRSSPRSAARTGLTCNIAPTKLARSGTR
jgi:hypothetical protein